ncbi:MAG: hypothetical protein AAGA56_08300, partial [Myxococcota bacterium]
MDSRILEDRERQAQAAVDARKLAVKIIGGLLLVAVPFGWSVYSGYRNFKDYAVSTIDQRATPFPWEGKEFDVEACVSEGLNWIKACPGYEEFCRRGLPTYIGMCMESAGHDDWCSRNLQETMRTTFGYQSCQRRIQEGVLDNMRKDKHRCAEAYEAAARWCGENSSPAAPATVGRA